MSKLELTLTYEVVRPVRCIDNITVDVSGCPNLRKLDINELIDQLREAGVNINSQLSRKRVEIYDVTQDLFLYQSIAPFEREAELTSYSLSGTYNNKSHEEGKVKIGLSPKCIRNNEGIEICIHLIREYVDIKRTNEDQNLVNSVAKIIESQFTR